MIVFARFIDFTVTYLLTIPTLILFMLYPATLLGVWWKNRKIYNGIPAPNVPVSTAMIVLQTKREYGLLYWMALLSHICVFSSLLSLAFLLLCAKFLL